MRLKMSYNRNAWDTQRRSRKSDQDKSTYLVPVERGGFNPGSDYIQKSVDEFQKSGGQITVIVEDYPTFMAMRHTSQADQFLLGQ
jgi:hypothetical protein